MNRYWRGFFLMLGLIFITPLISLIYTALTGNFENIRHLLNTVMWGYLKNTIGSIIGVGFGTIMLGVGSAFIISFYQFPGRKLMAWMLLLPLAFPGFIMTTVYLELLDYAGPVQSWLRSYHQYNHPNDYWFPEFSSLGGAIFILSLALFPYVYLLARTAFMQQAASLIDAAKTLSSSTLKVFTQINLPLARPAIAVGVSLVLMETLAEFGTMQLLAVETLTTGIYQTWFNHYDIHAAAQLALGLIIIVILLVFLEQNARKKQAIFARHKQQKKHKKLTGWSALMALILCALPVLFGFILPFGFLLWWSAESWHQVDFSLFTENASNSLLFASVSAALTVIVGLLFAYGIRLNNNKFIRRLNRLTTLGYAIPGPVLAIGLLIPLSGLDGYLNTWFKTSLNWDLRYVLSGTLVILIFAYLIRFLTISYGAIESGLKQIHPHMEDVSRCLGGSQFSKIRKVHLPLLRGSLISAALLIFVDVMKELPLTLMLQPLNLSTLAIQAYSYAIEEELKISSLWCIFIVSVGLLPMIILHRQNRLD